MTTKVLHMTKEFRVDCSTCVHGKGRKECKILGSPTDTGIIPSCPFYA